MAKLTSTYNNDNNKHKLCIEDATAEALEEAIGGLQLSGKTFGLSSARVSSSSSNTPAQLSGGYYLADEVIVKITYASLPEQKGVVDASGSWKVEGLAGDTPLGLQFFQWCASM